MTKKDLSLAFVILAVAIGLGLYLRWQQERVDDNPLRVCGGVSAGLTSWDDLPIAQAASAPDSPSSGSPNAPVVVEIWGDYACPYTRAWLRESFSDLREYFGDEQVRFVWRDMPLDFHPEAMKMAQLARCTGAQYWQFATLTPTLDDGTSKDASSIAAGFGVDPTQCLSDPEVFSAIEYDKFAAQAAGLQAATPTFVINGRVMQGAVNTPTFAEIIFEAMRSR